MKDVSDQRPVDDVLCPHEGYLTIHAEAGLEVVEIYRPLGRADEAQAWVNETRVAPWSSTCSRLAGRRRLYSGDQAR